MATASTWISTVRSPGASRAALAPAVLALALAAWACERSPTSTVDPKVRAEGLYVHGTALYLQGNFEESLRAFEEMKAIVPDDPRLPAAFGEVHLSQGKLREALPLFEEAAQRDPKRSTNWSRIGFIRSQLGQTEEAKSALRKAIALNPHDHVALEALAEIDLEEGRLDEAVSSFALAAESSLNQENGAQLLLKAARALQKAGRDADALELLQTSEQRGVRTPAVLTEMGELLVKARRFEDAVGVLTIAAQLNRTDPTLWEMVGELYVALDKPGDALNAFRESLKVKERAVVHVALARLHRARKDPGAAEEALQKALRTATGEDERESLELARLLAEFGRKEDALTLLDTLASEPDNADDVALQLETAKLARALGRTRIVAAACERARAADAGVNACP